MCDDLISSTGSTPMRLSAKTAIVVAAAFAVATIANVILLQVAVQPTFLALDETHATADHNRARDAIKADLQSLGDKTQDWSHWDDSYNFALGKTPDFPAENMQPAQIQNMGASAAVVTAPDFKILFQVQSSNAGTAEATKLFLGPYLPNGLRVSGDDANFNARVFPIRVGRAPYLAAIAPIVKSDGTGPIAGYIVFLRTIDAAYVAELSDRTEVNMAVNVAAGKVAERSASDDTIVTRSMMADNANVPVLEVQTRSVRAVKKLGETVLLWTSLGLALVGILATLATVGVINRLVVSPITRISRHMDLIGRSGDLTVKLASQQNDEIGTLTTRLNHMAADLDVARKQMIDQTHASGMAEMAADVLHNVRNAMTPMTVGVWTLQKHLASPVPPNLQRAVQELSKSDVGGDRREKLAKFASASIEEILTHRDKVADGFRDFIKTAHHIEDVLRDFDAVSMGPRRLESVSLVEVAATAQELTTKSLPSTPAITVAVASDFAKLPLAHGSRVVLQQVLVNLLKNASEAIQRSGAASGSISITGGITSEGGDERLHLRVTDTGVGIEPGKLETIFARGETTNTGVNRGLGLHWCANSLVAMSGRIFATSDGPGTGATFHVVLRIFAQGREKAA